MTPEPSAAAFPAPSRRTDLPPAPVRWGVTAAALAVSLGAGALLWERAAMAQVGITGESHYNSGDPALAYPLLQEAVRGTRLYGRPCMALGDMAVWAIDDGVFQHFYRIENPWALAKLAFLAYAEALDRQPAASKAWAGMAELFKKVRILRIKEGVVDLDALEEGAPAVYDEEDRLVIEAYRRALRFEPNNYFYHAYLGDFLDERGFREEALAQYARAVEIMPDLSWHYYLPARDVPPDLYAATSAALERALTTNPGYPSDRVWQNLGDLAERGRDPETAALSYQRAAASAVDPSRYYQLLGALYFTERRYEEAEVELKKAIERGTLQPRVESLTRILLGRCAMAREDYRTAVEHLQRAKWLYPTSAPTAMFLARAYESLRMLDKAEAEYQSAIRLEPKRASAYTALIEMYRRTHQVSKAIPLAEKLILMFPDDPVFKQQLRALERDLGRPEAG